MGPERLANKILSILEKCKTPPPWLQEVLEDLKMVNIGLAKVWTLTLRTSGLEDVKDPSEKDPGFGGIAAEKE